MIVRMNKKFTDIRVLIWDFDGTLYRQQIKLFEQIRESEYRVLMDRMHWSHEKAVEEFHKVFAIQTPSGTQSVSIITGISMNEAAIETGSYVDYRQYLKPDPLLGVLFEKLRNFRHMMLVNGTQDSVAKGLSLLHVNPHIFEEIVTSEIVGETKPSIKGFEYIMKKTGLPAGAHMMIGDREAVDLVPAKSLGMKTCLVWSEKESVVADVTVQTVYEIADMLA